MKLSRVKWIVCLTVCLATTLVAGMALFLREPVLIHWYSHQLENVDDTEKWGVARRLEDLGVKGAKVAEDWYLSRLSTTIDRERREAALSLGRLGSVKAVPRLLESLAGQERFPWLSSGSWPLFYVSGLKSIGPPAVSAIRRGAKAPATVIRFTDLLLTMGLDARVAIPALGRILTRQHTHEVHDGHCDSLTGELHQRLLRELDQAMQSLVRIAGGAGPGAREALRTLIDRTAPDPTCQRRLTRVLLHSGFVPRAVAKAVRSVEESSEHGRDFKETIASLVRRLALSTDPERALVAYLLDGCLSDFYFVRSWSAHTLHEMIAEDQRLGRTVIPSLIAELRHRVPSVRVRAFYALRRVGPALEPNSTIFREVVAAFSDALNDPHSTIRREASRALLEIAPEVASEVAIPSLRELLEAPDAASRSFAAAELGHVLGVLGKPPPPRLFAALRDPEAGVRLDAAVALGRIAPDEVLPFLVCELREPDWLSREAVFGVLRVIGPAAGPAVPELIPCLKDPSLRVRTLAVNALASIGVGAAAAVGPLVDVLESPDEDVPTRLLRRSAASALGAIGRRAAPAVPALEAALADEDRELQKCAVGALGWIGPAAVSAVPLLRQLPLDSFLQDSVPEALRRILVEE